MTRKATRLVKNLIENILTKVVISNNDMWYEETD